MNIVLRKKFKIVMGNLFSVICMLGGALTVSQNVAALSESELMKKTLLNALWTCSSSTYMLSGTEEITQSAFSQFGLDWLWTDAAEKTDVVYVPTQLGNTVSNSKITCKEAFVGAKEASGFLWLGSTQTMKGLDELYGKSSNNIEDYGYGVVDEASENNQGCVSINYTAPDDTGHSQNYKTNSVCFSLTADNKVNTDYDSVITNNDGNGSAISLYYNSGYGAIMIQIPASQYQEFSQLAYPYDKTWDEVVAEMEAVLTGTGEWSDGFRPIDGAMAPFNEYSLGYTYKSLNTSTEATDTFKVYGLLDDSALITAKYYTGNDGLTRNDVKFTPEEAYALYETYFQRMVDNKAIYLGADCQADKNKITATYKHYDGNGKWCDVIVTGDYVLEEKFNVVSNQYTGLTPTTFGKILEIMTNWEHPEVGVIDPSEETTSDEETKTEEEQTCMGAGKAGSLGWIVCPILEWATETIDDLYSDAVEPALQVKPQLFNESGDGAKTKEAWVTFQTMANIVFIILFLVVIFSQLTGVGIDNYGIKRILPKMIVAAILVNLSYYICVIAVDLSNIVGNGLQSMFNNMADAIGVTTINVGDTGVGGAGVIAAILIIAAVMVLAIVANPAILLTFFVTVLGALISVFFLFVLLSARQAAILILTVISPLAFVSYMLPNTKKSFFDKWLKLGQGLLMVYPIAGLLVGGGNYASTLLFYVGGETTNLFSAITAIIVGVAPIFFTPTVLKSAFAAMGTLGAKISGLGAGMRGRFDRAARNSEAYRGLQQRGQERRMRVRAGLNKDGTVATGRFARFMSAGPGRNRRRAAASAVIDKNYATDRYGDTGFLEAKAASRQIAQENAEVKEQEALISNSRDAHGGSIIDDTAEMQRRYQNALLGLDERGNRVGINESKIRAYQNLLTAKGDDGRQAVHRAVRDAEQHGASTEALRIHASNLIGSHGGDYKANSRSTFDHANGILNGKTASMSTYENDHAKLVGSIKPETLGAMDDDEFGRLISNAGATAASQQALADAAYEASQNESAMANVKKSRKDQIMALAASSAQQAANEARESQLASQQEQVFRVQQEQIAQVAGPATRAINYGNGVGGSTITIDVGEFAMPSSFETSKVSSTYVTAKDGAKHHLLSHDGKIWDATAGEYIKMNKFKNT